MRTHIRQVLPAALLFIAASGCTRVLWRPSLVTHVPDGKEVRYRMVSNGSTAVIGRALDWEKETPRLITPRGDTLVIPAGARVEVKVDHPDNHSKAGAIIGYLVAVVVMQANCNQQHIKYCGEQDPTPLLGSIAGGLIGSLLREDWVTLAWSWE